MKKLFTLAAALLASLTMMAETITLAEVTAESNWYAMEGVGRVTNKSGNAFSSGEMSCEGITGYKTGSSYFTIQTYQAISSITVGAQSSSNRTIGKVYVSEDLKSSAQGASNVEYAVIGGSEQYAIVSNSCGNEFTLNFTNEIAENSYIQIVLSGNAEIFAVTMGASTPSTDPVESAEISGADACALGGSIELTCNAPKATTYQWSMNGAEIEGANAKKYTFTPTAAGEFSFTCAASNDNTTTPVVSDAFEVTVTDPATACGELIKATHTGAKTATVTGVLGGTVDKNTASDGKFGGKDQYFGITLASGAFMAGDEMNVHTTTAAQQGTIAIYADKSGATLLYDTESMGAQGDNIIILPAAANNVSTLYICRTNANNWNGYVDYISVNRSCEASNNADLEKVWIQVGEMYQEYEAAEDGLTYNLAVPASVDLAELDVYFTLAHPKANANVTSPVHFTVPEAGQSVSATVAVTAQDGETVKTYTINVSKSAAASTEAHLSSLSVAGYTLVPEFAEDVLEYTITKAYGAENPGTAAITAEPKDPTAHPHAEALENALKITVTAEDNETQVVYTINIVEAEAEKVLNEIVFSNGYLGYNPVSDPQTNDIYAFYLEGEDAPSVQSCNIKGASWSVENDILTITGGDNTTEEFPLHIEAVTPVAFSADKISFVGTEAWVKAPYGFADGTDNKKQGFLFSKTDSDFSREKAGKTHVEMFLPACDTIVIFAGDPSTERDVKFFINGVQFGDITKLVKAGVTLVVEQNAAFMLTVASAQTGGDGGIGAIRMAKKSDETALEGIKAGVKAVKVVRNGQLYILKGDVLYNALGTIVK